MGRPREVSLYLRASKAADALDMSKAEFMALVREGILPQPVRIGEAERWSVSDLEAIKSGEAFEAAFQW